MNVADLTIEEALDAFVAEKAKDASPETVDQYEAIIELLSGYMDSYAYESLSPAESELWRPRWEEDEEANSFCLRAREAPPRRVAVPGLVP